MIPFTACETISLYRVNVCPEDMWMDVGDFVGELSHWSPSDAYPMGLYCAMSNTVGTFVLFSTGTEFFRIDMDADYQFLEYYEALNEQVSPEYIEGLSQLSNL